MPPEPPSSPSSGGGTSSGASSSPSMPSSSSGVVDDSVVVEVDSVVVVDEGSVVEDSMLLELVVVSPRSSGPIRRVGSSCIGSGLRSQDRVEDRVGVLDLETVSKPLGDLLPAAAGNRQLGGEQPRAGGVRAPGVRLRCGSQGRIGRRRL